MANSRTLQNTKLEFDTAALRRRFFEVLPGTMSWTTLIGLAILSFYTPFYIAIFIIAFDVYILIRAAYMSVHLVYAYLRLRLMRPINWLERLAELETGPKAYLTKVNQQISDQSNWQLKQLRSNLNQIIKSGHPISDWRSVQHVIILPTYDESIAVLRTSLTSLTQTDFPLDKLHVVVGFEQRIGDSATQKADTLQAEFGQSFGTFLTTFHPDGLPGEKRVKSANATWAIKKIEQLLYDKGITTDDVLVSNFDSDTVVSPNYFSYLTYSFVTHPDRYHASYQPLPMYNNNIWDAPAFSRVIATGSTFWQMIESTRPERLVTFSSHSMTLRALQDVGYWQTDIVSEDSRIFWQCLLHYNGRYTTEPLYTSVSMDAALANSWWRTLVNQYKQKRRWAWGIENFPYLAEGFIQRPKVPRSIKWIYTIRTLEGHYAWATTAIIVAGLGWLPIFFGGPQFHTTVLSYSLPFVARTIMSIAMLGLIISTTLSLLLLPPKPSRISSWRYLAMFIQWALVPLIATILSAFPALDAETRLMLGRDLGFNVMQKSRKTAHRA